MHSDARPRTLGAQCSPLTTPPSDISHLASRPCNAERLTLTRKSGFWGEVYAECTMLRIVAAGCCSASCAIAAPPRRKRGGLRPHAGRSSAPAHKLNCWVGLQRPLARVKWQAPLRGPGPAFSTLARGCCCATHSRQPSHSDPTQGRPSQRRHTQSSYEEHSLLWWGGQQQDARSPLCYARSAVPGQAPRTPKSLEAGHGRRRKSCGLTQLVAASHGSALSPGVLGRQQPEAGRGSQPQRTAPRAWHAPAAPPAAASMPAPGAHNSPRHHKAPLPVVWKCSRALLLPAVRHTLHMVTPLVSLNARVMHACVHGCPASRQTAGVVSGALDSGKLQQTNGGQAAAKPNRTCVRPSLLCCIAPAGPGPQREAAAAAQGEGEPARQSQARRQRQPVTSLDSTRAPTQTAAASVATTLAAGLTTTQGWSDNKQGWKNNNNGVGWRAAQQGCAGAAPGQSCSLGAAPHAGNSHHHNRETHRTGGTHHWNTHTVNRVQLVGLGWGSGCPCRG